VHRDVPSVISRRPGLKRIEFGRRVAWSRSAALPVIITGTCGPVIRTIVTLEPFRAHACFQTTWYDRGERRERYLHG